MKKCSRLGIFACFDRDGRIDDYILYLLDDLKENLERLVVVANGRLTPEGRSRLGRITGDVVVRENSGFDAAAFRFAMIEYLGWEELGRYEELVLLNDTFFGPFYPFQIVFERMAGKAADFWGLTAHGKGRDMLGGHYESHLQSYFLVIRRRMHSSFEFRDYWERQKEYRDFLEAVQNHEVRFTQHFEKRGFTWEPYIDMSDLDGSRAMNHYAFDAEELLKRGFPVLKRKQFQEPLRSKLQYHNGEDYRKALQYIRQHYAYDIRMIWQNILRLYNISDIHDSLGLEYVIDNAFLSGAGSSGRAAAAAVLHITYVEHLERYRQYISAVPEWMDVFITTISDGKKRLLEEAFSGLLGSRLTVICMKNRGRDLAAMLVAAKPHILKYDYFCFCHDKISKQTEYSIGKYFDRLLWENTLSSSVYVENIISRFESEPGLGIMTVPCPVGGFVSHYQGNLWTVNYQNTAELLRSLDVEVPITASAPLISLGTAFWCRTAALKKLLDHEWRYADFPEEPLGVDGEINHALERCFPYVAQDAGYYTAVVMTPEYAEILVNAYKYLAFHPADSNAVANYMCLTEDNMPDVGVQGAWHLLKLTLKRYFKKPDDSKNRNRGRRYGRTD